LSCLLVAARFTPDLFRAAKHLSVKARGNPRSSRPRESSPFGLPRDAATGEDLFFLVLALETYRAAVRRWPKDKITLRNRARVIEWSWQD
jgi:hypothetical protein